MISKFLKFLKPIKLLSGSIKTVNCGKTENKNEKTIFRDLFLKHSKQVYLGKLWHQQDIHHHHRRHLQGQPGQHLGLALLFHLRSHHSITPRGNHLHFDYNIIGNRILPPLECTQTTIPYLYIFPISPSNNYLINNICLIYELKIEKENSDLAFRFFWSGKIKSI